MAFDIGKAFKVGTIPIVVLILLSIFSTVVGAIPFLNVLLCVVGIPILIIGWVVTAWAGFKAVKEAGMDLVGGALTGGLVAFVAGVVGGIIGFVVQMLGVGMGVAGGADLGGAAINAGLGVVGIVVGVIGGTVIGLILGAIGAFVAGMKK